MEKTMSGCIDRMMLEPMARPKQMRRSALRAAQQQRRRRIAVNAMQGATVAAALTLCFCSDGLAERFGPWGLVEGIAVTFLVCLGLSVAAGYLEPGRSRPTRCGCGRKEGKTHEKEPTDPDKGKGAAKA